MEGDLDLLINGKTENGIKALEAFKTKHPKSHNLASVQEAIDKAKSLSVDKTTDAPASAAPAKNSRAPNRMAARMTPEVSRSSRCA